jgi:hypothetical protein
MAPPDAEPCDGPRRLHKGTRTRPLRMRETLELRVNESHAHRVFGAGEGVALSDRIRKVVIPTNDERLALVRDVDAELRASGSPLFFGYPPSASTSRSRLGGWGERRAARRRDPRPGG